MNRIKELDSIKFLLILLVVLGHYLETSMSFLNLRDYIYIFHMPLFVTITGFTFKKYIIMDFNLKKILNRTIYPFIFFQILYLLLTRKFTSFYIPYYHLWYIFSLFFWCGITFLLRKRNNIITYSIILSLIGGALFFVGYPLGISRTLTFLPFFALGVTLNKDKMLIKNKSLFLLIFIAAILTTITFKNLDTDGVLSFINMTKGSDNYYSMNLTLLYGVIFKILYYIMTFSYVIIILHFFIKNKITILSKHGKSSFYIYIYHFLILNIFYKIFRMLHLFKYIQGNFILLISLTYVTVLCCMFLEKLILFLKIKNSKKNKILDLISEIHP